MSCFSLLWFFQLLVEIACIMVLIMVAQIWLPGLIGWDPRITATIRVLIGLFVFCIIVWFIYDVITCVGFGFPRAMR
jgi:uncharacterized BrkB/YihY/UPF0761 family membrane protein